MASPVIQERGSIEILIDRPLLSAFNSGRCKTGHPGGRMERPIRPRLDHSIRRQRAAGNPVLGPLEAVLRFVSAGRYMLFRPLLNVLHQDRATWQVDHCLCNVSRRTRSWNGNVKRFRAIRPRLITTLVTVGLVARVLPCSRYQLVTGAPLHYYSNASLDDR